MMGTVFAESTPLCSTYKKPVVRMRMGLICKEIKQDVLVDLPPVLFHGTAEPIMNYLINNRPKLSRLSTSSDPLQAATFASYQIEYIRDNDLQVVNNWCRRFNINLQQAGSIFPIRMDGLSPVARSVANSLVLLDRDAVIDVAKEAPQVELLMGEGREVSLRGSPHNLFPFPTNTVIGILDFYPEDESQRLVTLRLRILNSSLWQSNFIKGPPFSNLTFKMPGLVSSGSWFNLLVQQLFGRPLFSHMEPLTCYS
ncbi:hypothetical protein HZC35_07170 [Candidatus Saganbacteria bacterium]|nr:hypothetical protein [Candidatus Saganbacteria bacterium]